MRPDVGTQSQFRKKKPPQTYRYDSSLSPALDWDGANGTRELGEWLLDAIARASRLNPPHEFAEPQEFRSSGGLVLVTVRGLTDAVEQLKRLAKPFLNWAGKAERLSFDVPTLPLFVHERLSTKTIVDTLVGHRTDRQLDLYDMFGDPQHSITDQVLRAYEYQDKWVNRMVLGDSLVVMNSLLQYEGLGGQVQMIYIDPPYGVKFGSNFQPFVRKRDVSHNDDEDLTREPEMVKAYRDTWDLGLHSYLTYMRDRLLMARELLTPSGSVFVQISDENLHHVRELMDEVFGTENFASVIPFRKKTMPLGAKYVESVTDYLLWYARDYEKLRYHELLQLMDVQGDTHWNYVELPDGSRRKMTSDEVADHTRLPTGAVPCQLVSLYPAGVNQSGLFPFQYRGKTYKPPPGNSWFTNEEGMKNLAAADRLEPYEDGETLRYVLKLTDSGYSAITNLWSDTSAPSDKMYAVQTSAKVIQRCILMTTNPGDLVLDPTCGSGTTAYVAEEWGRRWIAIDVSRVPLALARQRLLTATYPWYELVDPARGPVGGFVYRRRQNKRGIEVGGIVPYVTKGSVASQEVSAELVRVDAPERSDAIVRVTGPFAFEATIPTPVDWEGDGVEDSGVEQAEDYSSFVERMVEVLRRSPVLHVGGGRTVQLANLRQPAKSLSLSAEGISLNGDQKPVAFVFGPENGAISEKLVHAALKEAHLKSYAHLYVIGFAIQPHARELVENAAAVGFLPATYVQATPDLMMGDLLKNMRSSQIFSVCGLPEVKVHAAKPEKRDAPPCFQLELVGLDTFDPATMAVDHRRGDDVPAWFVDTDYNGLCFHVSQAFFPRTGAWNDLRKALKSDYDDSVWEHLAGTRSAPFEAGEHRQVAVKVIDDRGNELLVVKPLAENA
ncbi:MAG: site-specific DNA-methyltransferase [Acidobacteria bacterium]|nr:site-specific DNA-methyltransferase [Acidobacteriota bacterium]